MKRWGITLAICILSIGCDKTKSRTESSNDSAPPSPVTATPGAPARPQTLAEARKNFKTKLIHQVKSGDPVAQPPAQEFGLVHYDSPVGKLAAYLTPDPHDGLRHPAIIWITGGDCNSIGNLGGGARGQ